MIYAHQNDDPETVLIDMDEITCMLAKKCLTRHNEEFGTNLTYADITEWGMPCVEMYLNNEGWFEDLEPMPGAIENINRLREGRNGKKVRVLFLTSPYNIDCAGSKYRWLARYFPWSSHKDVFMGHEKFRVAGRFLLDDSPKNLRKWSKRWPNGQALAIAYEYNLVAADVAIRFEGWRNPEAAWSQMVDHILERL